MPGWQGLNLVRGNPRPPAGHCEGAPLVLLPLLGNCEGRRVAIAALVAMATTLAWSVNFFSKLVSCLPWKSVILRNRGFRLTSRSAEPFQRWVERAHATRRACTAAVPAAVVLAILGHGYRDFTKRKTKKSSVRNRHVARSRRDRTRPPRHPAYHTPS